MLLAAQLLCILRATTSSLLSSPRPSLPPCSVSSWLAQPLPPPLAPGSLRHALASLRAATDKAANAGLGETSASIAEGSGQYKLLTLVLAHQRVLDGMYAAETAAGFVAASTYLTAFPRTLQRLAIDDCSSLRAGLSERGSNVARWVTEVSPTKDV